MAWGAFTLDQNPMCLSDQRFVVNGGNESPARALRRLKKLVSLLEGNPRSLSGGSMGRSAGEGTRVRTAGNSVEEGSDESLHELIHRRLGLRIWEKIVVLLGVIGQVEKLTGRAGVLVDDDLVLLGLEERETPVFADRHRSGAQDPAVQVA